MRLSFLFLLIAICFGIVSAWNPFPEGQKTSWPELVGMNSEEAAEIVRRECEDCSVKIRHHHSPMTMDLRIDRVRIFEDDNHIVVQEPRRG